MTFGFVTFTFATIGYVILALANVESMRAPARRRVQSTRHRTPTPPSRD
ncbi:MAG TPA: hypothetical protein VL966_13035 [Alphaproteobacteria bacterium]|jgi:hypothetical protein|nr:hypothetical protein [Alphaproteobacteria bacterium]